MTQIERILDQLRRAFSGDAWHGPALLELLDGVDAKQAASRPLASAHSIWEIVLHISVWEDAVRRRLGGEVVEPTGEQNWPTVHDTSDAAWQLALQSLARGMPRWNEPSPPCPNRAWPTPFPATTTLYISCCMGSCSTTSTMPDRSPS